MSIERRTADRRRRVLYSAHQTDPTTGDDLERLREARRPGAAYGTRVRRRLRARWFSLVPVRRSTMTMLASVILGIAFGLSLAHYAAVAWPSIAYRPEVARPLRLDRPDSFGRWFMIAMLTGTAGAAFLVYQLRRHRNDDFAGRYRLWRTVQVVALLASLQVVVSIIDWGGALLDLAFGQRVALSGADWIRLVVMFGGAILALQVLAEVRRCRAALGLMLFALLCWVIPEAANWNVLEVSTLNRWVLVTATPLLATTAVFVATVAYLRMVYREVRQVEDHVSFRDRWQRMQASLFDRDPDAPQQPIDEDSKQPRKKKWFGGRDRDRDAERSERAERKRQKQKVRKAEEESKRKTDKATDSEAEADDSSTNKRRWFQRKEKKERTVESRDAQSESESGETANAKPKKKRRRFSLRLTPPNGEQAKDEPETSAKQPESNDDSSGESRKGIGGWLRRKKSAEPEQAEEKPEPKQSPSKPSPQPAQETIDPEEIDWNALSKSERRRLRKQLKRQNRAA